MRKVKGFGYDPERDKDVIEHIDKQPNKSQYILNLVRKDMEKNDNDLENLVRKYVEKVLKEKNIETDTKNIDVTKKDVMNLLNIGK